MGIRILDKTFEAKKHFAQGTHRTIAPSETLRNNGRWMEPMGITRLANITGLDRIGVPVFVAIRPTSRSLVTAQGKGETVEAAKASALMESIESWHAENLSLPIRYESYGRLATEGAVLDISRLVTADLTVPALNCPLYWIEGWDLMASTRLFVPHELVTLNCVPPAHSRFTFPPSSNGLASGNHLLEAITHGLCEVIERDAVALWEFGKRRATTRIDLDSIDDPAARAILGKLSDAGVDCEVWDATSDLGVPTYAAEIEDSESDSTSTPGVFGGYGTHLSPAVALMRALSEAVQSRLAFISGSRDDLFESKYRWFSRRSKRPRTPASRVFHARSDATPTFEGDVAVLLEKLRARGVEQVAVVDLSRPEFGIPVVKVVVPGLEAKLARANYSPSEANRRRLSA